MACPSVTSGNQFLSSVLAQIDCQAQTIGSFGYGALAGGSSPIAGLMLSLLTVFIAVFGFRLILGGVASARDGFGAVLKVGIVLTLATSWPAWRTLAYDVVFQGPGELSASIAGGAGLPYGPASLERRLQNLDDGIVALTAFGSGRLTGAIVSSSDLGDSTQGIALADQSGLGLGRVAFLVGVIAPLGVVRLGGGILLALAPLVSGLLLFGATRSLFFGYLRALGYCALGAMGLALVYATQLAVMEPWLADALEQREANVLMPAAPTELLVLTLGFALLATGWLALLAKGLFFGETSIVMAASSSQALAGAVRPDAERTVERRGFATGSEARVQALANAMTTRVLREEQLAGRAESAAQRRGGQRQDAPADAAQAGRGMRLGSSYRRQSRRVSAAAQRRDVMS